MFCSIAYHLRVNQTLQCLPLAFKSLSQALLYKLDTPSGQATSVVPYNQGGRGIITYYFYNLDETIKDMMRLDHNARYDILERQEEYDGSGGATHTDHFKEQSLSFDDMVMWVIANGATCCGFWYAYNVAQLQGDYVLEVGDDTHWIIRRTPTGAAPTI